MIFYQNETWGGLLLASLPAILSLYLFFYKQEQKTALVLLLISTFLLRILMVSLDPYLHPWDERYHALVAKNVMSFPFKPMLFVYPVMPYDMADWSYNHVWLNKQPLFLWQMALSMKIFGVNTIALRLPSVIMGTLLTWMTFDIARHWLKNNTVAFMSAFITCFSMYSLELISGRYGLDHNDLAFVFYITCNFWAWTRYTTTGFQLKWCILIGVFAGLAVMNKWLTGLLIFGGWGLYLLISKSSRFNLKKYAHLLLSLCVSFLVFIPWQIYINQTFPEESAIVLDFHHRHLTEDFGHPGTVFFHISFLPIAYDYLLLAFFMIGLYFLFRSKKMNPEISVAFVAMIIVIYCFFSFFVKTKMPSYVYPVSSLVIIISAFGLFSALSFIQEKWKLQNIRLLSSILLLIVGLFALKPWSIAIRRSVADAERNKHLYNTAIYKKMKDFPDKERIILNCRAWDNIDLMFYSDLTAYHYYPSEQLLDSVQAAGYKFAAFDYTDTQKLPDYMKNDKEILILPDRPK